MSKFFIPAAVIEAATAGAVHQKMMVNWNERNLWQTELQPAERGRPRLYSYDNALEAMLAGAMARSGMTRERSRARIGKRCVDVFGRVSGWVGDVAQNLSLLPEWGWSSAWWIFADDLGLIAATGSASDIPTEWEAQDVIHLVNLTNLKARLDKAVSDAGLVSPEFETA